MPYTYWIYCKNVKGPAQAIASLVKNWNIKKAYREMGNKVALDSLMV